MANNLKMSLFNALKPSKVFRLAATFALVARVLGQVIAMAAECFDSLDKVITMMLMARSVVFTIASRKRTWIVDAQKPVNQKA
ncbi:hypothetical protein [Aliiglaciecola litoralis]|uniref:hypothetical protein n=1 Tax=Aliiglaciecola litoralis TaxID=582857 RepID=UPI0031DA21AD